MSDRSCLHVPSRGIRLSRRERHLLDVLAEEIGSCGVCGTSSTFTALWTPQRRVGSVWCVCGALLWLDSDAD